MSVSTTYQHPAASIADENREWLERPKAEREAAEFEVQAVHPEFVKFNGCTLIIDIQSLPFAIRPGDKLKLITR